MQYRSCYVVSNLSADFLRLNAEWTTLDYESPKVQVRTLLQEPGFWVAQLVEAGKMSPFDVVSRFSGCSGVAAPLAGVVVG
jgi:hypothetical protein